MSTVIRLSWQCEVPLISDKCYEALLITYIFVEWIESLNISKASTNVRLQNTF